MSVFICLIESKGINTFEDIEAAQPRIIEMVKSVVFQRSILIEFY